MWLLGILVSTLLLVFFLVKPAKAHAPEQLNEDVALTANETDVETLYRVWLAKKAPSGACSCVIWAKTQLGYTNSVGAAKNWPINSQEPEVGEVIITSESSLGHVGLIISIDGDLETIEEANYERCRVTKRTINKNAPFIRGYWKG